MVNDLKYFDGSLGKIDRVPAGPAQASTPPRSRSSRSGWSRRRARRQKWIDQAQSLNIYMAGASGKKLDETYKLAWLRGLKTTYYLRTMGATHAEKSTSKAGQLNAVSNGARGGVASIAASAARSGRERRDRERASSARSTTPSAKPVSEQVHRARAAGTSTAYRRARCNRATKSKP